MTIPPWREEPLTRRHNRQAFDCGDDALNEFLRRYARQTHEQGGAKTFVAVTNADPTRILGFYSLSPASIEFSRTPAVITRGLARHDVPVFRLGRLAVDHTMQRKGLGGQLLLVAGQRCLRAAQEVGGVALLIDAKNDAVATWYASYGAMPLLDQPLTLLLPLITIQRALQATNPKERE
jgi:GNAT superfamily N-acetyltransferase